MNLVTQLGHKMNRDEVNTSHYFVIAILWAQSKVMHGDHQYASGKVPSTQMNKLQLVQNPAAKIILGGKKTHHVIDHLIKLHWLPISQRRTFKIMLLVFKALNGQGPIYLAEMLVPCSNSEHDLRSSYDNLLVVPATESVTYGDHAFSVLGT